MIRILLVDDQNLVRQGIQAMLEPRPKLKVVGTAEDGNSAIEQVGTLMPDIVLMDIEMPIMSGITATQKICLQFPKTKVLVLSSHKNQEHVARALQAGAEGYLLKNTLAEDLEQAIWSVYRGHSQIESRLLKKVLAKKPVSQSVKSVKLSESNVLGEQLLQKTSHIIKNNNNISDTSNKRQTRIAESTESSQNGSLSKISKTTLKPVLKRQFKIEKPSDLSRETLDIKISPIEQADKELFVRQNSTEREKSQPKKRISLKLFKWWIRVLVIVPIISMTAITLVRFLNRPRPQISPAFAPVQAVPEVETVTALGRLEPSGEIIEISVSSAAGGNRIEELLVNEGEEIEKSQVIAVLDSRDHAIAALNQSQKQVRVAQANLALVKAGAKTGEIQAQKAKIARIKTERSNNIMAQIAKVSRIEAELNNAQLEYQRYEQLYKDGAISASERSNRYLAWKTAKERLSETQANLSRIKSSQQEQIAEAKATLDKITEVRPVDIAVAVAKVRQARAAVKTSQAELERAYIKSPQMGTVIKILTRPGETVSSDEGIARIGQIKKMYVVAEVYESDIGKVKLGQSVTVTSNAILAKLTGTVEKIGLEIERQNAVNTDPTANVDAKVAEVKIKLDQESSQKVAGLTNLQVNVKIDL